MRIGTLLAARGIFSLCLLSFALLLASCGGGGSSSESAGGAPTYSIGGTVLGLAGAGLVLQNNGGDNLPISANGAYTSPTSLVSGSAYSITVLTQPTNPSQTCSVTNGSGTVGTANVSNVAVNCVTNTYAIGGTVSGLAGTGLVLQNSGGDNLAILADGIFTFTTFIASGSAYAVTVLTPPTNLSQTCTVTNGSGTVGGANVTNVSISCATNSFTVGGTVSGHNNTGLTLRLNGTTNLPVLGNGAFAFPAMVDGSAYNVAVFSNPIQQVCTVNNPSGTLAGANVTNIAVTCTTNTYAIGGTVTGLAGTGLVLQNNLGDNLTISLNGGFTFSTPIAYNSTYSVTVLTHPTNPNQTCAVSNGSGTVTGNVTNVAIACVTNSSTIGGTVSGLAGTGLVLQNNSGNNLAISGNGAFTFSAPVTIGTPYNVTVFSQPTNASQTCTVANGSGTTPITAVTNVQVTCVTNTYMIGGTVSGLAGTGLVLQNNTGNNLAISGNGAFTFSSPIASGAAYAVTVLTHPSNPTQTCTVGSGSGTVTSADVTSVGISCTTNSYTIGGAISGLAGTGLVLQNNLGDNLTVPASATNFTFSASILSGATYAVTVLTQPSNPTQTCTVGSGSGTVTNANVTGVSITCTTNTYTIGGTVSGLAGAGLVLRNNGGNNLAISANGAFVFSTPIASGATYAVTVLTNPTNLSQTCTVTNGSGPVVNANISNVGISCTTNSFTVGGTVSGINTGSGGVTLRLNGANNLLVAADGSFTFSSTPLVDGSNYTVTVFVAPIQENCSVTNPSGTLAGANVTNIAVTCQTNTYTVGGSISGLSGAGLVLLNNGGDNLTVAANATSFTFNTQIAYNSAYAVTVLTQPSNPTQTCTFNPPASASGTVLTTVTSVSIVCTTNTYTIGGTITGLLGTGLVLNNGAENLTVLANATSFTFLTPVASGAGYAVTVSTQPATPTQTCTIALGTGSGTVTNANVTSVSITCTTNTYTIGGTVSGLAGTGLVLQNNLGNNFTVLANGIFTFTTPIASGALYSVTVLTQPSVPSQICTVTNGAGTVGAVNVTGVGVACVTPSPRFAYVANFDDGSVSIYSVNAQTGQLRHNGYVAAGTGPLSVSIDPSGRFAYVANFGSNDISAYAISGTTGALTPIDADSGTAGIQNFPAGTNPFSVTVDPSGRFAYVANSNSGDVSAYSVDSTTGALASLGTVAAGAGPRSVTVDPSGRFAYVANGDPGANSISAYTIDGTTGALTPIDADLGTGGIQNFPAGTEPRSVAVDPTGRFAYAANLNSANVSAYAINATTGVLTPIGLPVAAETGPRFVVVDPFGKFAYVANQNSGSVSAYAIDAVTGALTAVGAAIAAGTTPQGLAIDPSGTLAYALNYDSDNISAYTINTTTGALTALSAVTGRGGNISMAMTRGTALVYTPRFAYAANAGGNVSAYTINATTGALTSIGAAVPAGTTPASVSVDPSGRYAYVANGGGDVSAYTINATTGALTSLGAAVLAGTGPSSVSVEISGRFAYVANRTSGNVSVFTIAATGALTGTGTVAAGTSPASVSVDPSGKYVYVANGGGDVSAYTLSGTTGALTPIDADLVAPGIQNFPAGTNPVSVTVDPTGKFAYVANGGGDVSAYTINPATGVLTSVGATVAAGTTPASVSVDPSGRFAYVANGGGNVSAFGINAATGALTSLGAAVAAGTTPSSVSVDPSGRFAYVANSGGGDVSAYSINATTGALGAGATVAAGTGPSSVATTGTVQ